MNAIEFRPMAGLLSLGSQLAARLGLSHIWDGDEGLGAVAREKLKDMGVPESPIPLSGSESSLTPMQVAVRAGFIKKRRKVK